MNEEEKLGFEEASDESISFDFERVKKATMISNYIKIIDMLVPYYDTLAQARGELKKQDEIFLEAHQAFCEAKNKKAIDELNQIINPII